MWRNWALACVCCRFCAPSTNGFDQGEIGCAIHEVSNACPLSPAAKAVEAGVGARRRRAVVALEAHAGDGQAPIAATSPWQDVRDLNHRSLGRSPQTHCANGSAAKSHAAIVTPALATRMWCSPWALRLPLDASLLDLHTSRDTTRETSRAHAALRPLDQAARSRYRLGRSELLLPRLARTKPCPSS